MLVIGGPLWAAPDPYPKAARSYLLELDNEVLWERDAAAPLQPASLSKLLAALVVLDDGWNADRWLVIDADVAATPPTRLGLRTGEEITAGAALAAMLIRSANDACRALVHSVTADTGKFLERMNARAAQIGMTRSHFADPCGFDAPGQYSTATDLLKLARAARGHAVIARLTATPRAELRTRAGRTIHFTNTNQLLGRLDGAEGMKTGYTSQAGQCLIAYARRPGHDVWLVMLGGTQRWWLAHGMIDDAFDIAARR